MCEKPICRSMKFPVYEEMLARYQDCSDLEAACRMGGLNGLELILAEEADEKKITRRMVNGVHLYYHIFWMDWWKGNYARLDKEFDSREQWVNYYGGLDRESYLRVLCKELEYAEAMGAKYVVFHVSEVTLRESYLYQFRYSDEEVVSASLEIINTLLEERDYSFEFLVENLWWSGFNLKDAAITEKLIAGIHSEKKGIMFDMGHYMNTNPELKTAEDAVAYIHEMLDAHEKAGLLKWFKGVGVHMSLSGEYVKAQRREWKENPMDFDRIPFYELFRLSAAHMGDIDCHQPFIGAGVRELVERIGPKYVTFEFAQGSREALERQVELQSRELGYL